MLTWKFHYSVLFLSNGTFIIFLFILAARKVSLDPGSFKLQLFDGTDIDDDTALSIVSREEILYITLSYGEFQHIDLVCTSAKSWLSVESWHFQKLVHQKKIAYNL